MITPLEVVILAKTISVVRGSSVEEKTPVQIVDTADAIKTCSLHHSLRTGKSATALYSSDSTITSLRLVIESMVNGAPLSPLSMEMQERTSRIIAARGLPGDVVTWTHQLAGDISKLAD
jgi:hypothetical protein